VQKWERKQTQIEERRQRTCSNSVFHVGRVFGFQLDKTEFRINLRGRREAVSVCRRRKNKVSVRDTRRVLNLNHNHGTLHAHGGDLNGSVETRHVVSNAVHSFSSVFSPPFPPGFPECKQLFCARCALHAAAASSWDPAVLSILG
jgi:hypothetical protein